MIWNANIDVGNNNTITYTFFIKGFTYLLTYNIFSTASFDNLFNSNLPLDGLDSMINTILDFEAPKKGD